MELDMEKVTKARAITLYRNNLPLSDRQLYQIKIGYGKILIFFPRDTVFSCPLI